MTGEGRVPFLALGAQVAALRPQLQEAIDRVLDSGWFILGPEVEALEAELAERFESAECVTVGNGTEALQLALEAIGVGAGDEVVTSPMTAAFTALAIWRTGARAVFADVEQDTLNVSPQAVRAAITSKTRAIMPVHLYGHPAELQELEAIAGEHRVALVEDACQAHGARYADRSVGSFGIAAALSFYPTKNLGALGDGGAILTSDAELASKLRRLRNGGQSDRYSHTDAGINSRLDEIQAAILRVKLGHLESGIERRRHLATIYERELGDTGVTLPTERPPSLSARHLYVVRHPERDRLAAGLARRGVGTLIHYPIPVHLQPVFAAWGGALGDCPVAERAASEVLSLPLYPELQEPAVQYVCQAIRETVAEL